MLLIVYPTVVYGGFALLKQLVDEQHGYMDNPLREDVWRAGHAHAGVLLVLSLVLLRYVDLSVALRNENNFLLLCLERRFHCPKRAFSSH